MSDFVTLTCPTCGGKLQITNDIERFACSNCGNEHIVRRSGGVVSLSPIVEELTKVKTGVDKTASELAIRRIQEEIKPLETSLSGLLSTESKSVVGIVVSVLFIIIAVCSFIFGFYGGFDTGITLAIVCPVSIGISGLFISLIIYIINNQGIEKLRQQIRNKKSEVDKYLRIVQM